jgi:hypothetical protein
MEKRRQQKWRKEVKRTRKTRDEKRKQKTTP